VTIVPVVSGRTVIVEARRASDLARQAAPPTYACSQAKAATLRRILAATTSTATGAQIDRVLQALRVFPEGVSSVDLQRHLDIGDPRARVRDLREAGRQISSNWCWQEGAVAGARRRIVVYRLEAEDGPA
jgi:hypothetical protein